MNHFIDEELEKLEEELREPLRRAIAPPPSPAETAELIRRLQPEFDALKADHALESLQFNEQVEAPTLRKLLRSQFRLNRKSLIMSSSAVFLMLILLVDPGQPVKSIGVLPSSLFPVITPLMLIASMLFSYRTWNSGMRSIESITPYPPALVMYSRMLMVIALIVVWAFMSSVVVSVRIFQAGEFVLPLGPFLLQWLGITLLTSGAAMYVLFRKGIYYALASALAVYVLWFIYIDNSHSYLLRVEYRAIIDGLLLVAGVVLLLRSYYRSRKVKFEVGAGAGHDIH
ncbi:hypothetical protein MKX50_21335 [Paenibacillus sp. FSL W8-0186]|uniref:Uncharacterized protein n=1 Tax=Paenibacillus woosongensis TaxID=307580 RepID=A0ABQ4MWU4_9BACL|nr:hypothetical protein [Paenibacillus woosongensis]GIP60356.1 hypothetical protein J15TS10_41700 [Paenibacillus woosongensis]